MKLEILSIYLEDLQDVPLSMILFLLLKISS